MSKTAVFGNFPDIDRIVNINTPSLTHSSSPTSDFLTPVSQYSVSRNEDNDDSVKLSDVLNVLDFEDEQSIFIVRRISKLGFTAQESLGSFFANFGFVRRILLLPSRGKGDSRSRPASMGFVVMDRALDCIRVCQRDTYRIGFSDIHVQKFVRNAKIQVSDGYSVSNAYVPAMMPDMFASTPKIERFMSSELNTTVTLAQMEILVESMVLNLGI